METVEEVYRAFDGRFTMEWIGQTKTAAVLYFSNGKKEYKIFFDDSNVEISLKKRWRKEEYWESVGARHYNNPEDTVNDVFDTVEWCLQEYGGRK